MNISPVGQNNNQKVNFKAVIPVKVYGTLHIGNKTFEKEAKCDKALKSACIEVTKVLERRSDKSSEALLSKFNVYDYFTPDKKVEAGSLVRYFVDDGVGYIFTGKHAKHLHNLGKQLGKTKSEVLNRAISRGELPANCREIHTKEMMEKVSNVLKGSLDVSLQSLIYNKTMNDYVVNLNHRLKKVFGLKERVPAFLEVKSDCDIKRLKSGEYRYDFSIKDFIFKPIDDTNKLAS